jgi:hypothetical protein
MMYFDQVKVLHSSHPDDISVILHELFWYPYKWFGANMDANGFGNVGNGER